MHSNKTVSEYLQVILKWRNFLIQNVTLVTIFAIILSLVVTHKYTAVASILPPSSETESMFGLLGGGIVTQLSNISRITGRLPGMTTPSDLYAAILKSGTVKGKIIERFNLKEEFKVKTNYDASKALDEITRISITPEGIISIAVTYKNKYLATDIANAFVEELDKFNTETAMTTGKKYRIFIEQRLKATTDSLSKAEEALRKFQEQHRTVALDIEIENAIETIAKLKGEIILREIQKGAISSAGGLSNPYVTNIDQELRELKKQLSKIEFGTTDTARKEFGVGFSVPFARLPEISLEYARLLRDVKIQEAIYELLTQQYEQAKIMEAKDTPTVQFLDRASPPEKRSFPRRTLIVLFALLLSVFGSIPMIFLYEYLIDIKQNPTQHKRAFAILSTLVNDLSRLRILLNKFHR
ncbi:MAG: GumC family protein [bacterium]